MSSHTPTPWIAVPNDGAYVSDGDMARVRIEERSSHAELIVAVVISDVAALDPEANAEFIVRACNSHDALVAALEDLLPPMPPKDAICHVGIVPQEECANCKRIAAARAALTLARPTTENGNE